MFGVAAERIPPAPTVSVQPTVVVRTVEGIATEQTPRRSEHVGPDPDFTSVPQPKGGDA